MTKESRPSGKNILIVEDEVHIQRVLDRLLSPLGYQLFLAGSVQEAIQFIQAHAYDLLISDLHLPNGDGIRVLQEFRKKFSEVPMIVLSAALLSEPKLQVVKDLGIYAWIDKPFDLDFLKVSVDNALQSSR